MDSAGPSADDDGNGSKQVDSVTTKQVMGKWSATAEILLITSGMYHVSDILIKTVIHTSYIKNLLH